MEKMSYDEIVNACVVQATPNTADERAVVEHKTELFGAFKPLLKHYCADDKIASEELLGLWQFYVQGVRVKKFKEKNRDYSQLHEEAKRFEAHLNTPLKEVLSCPFEYQMAYHFQSSSARILETERQYERIFSISDDPIDWFVTNGNSYDTKTNTNKKIMSLWTRLYTAENTRFDPVLQK